MKASLEVAQSSETEVFDVCLVISVFNTSLHDTVYKFLKMMKTLRISSGWKQARKWTSWIIQ